MDSIQIRIRTMPAKRSCAHVLISSCSLRASSIILGSDHFSKKGTCVVKRVSPAGVGVTMSVMPSIKDILVTAGAAFLLATLVAGVWGSRRGDAWLTGRPSPGLQKRYSTEIAEGVRLRDFRHFGVDLLSFKSCRIEKLRRGPVTLGAFNVLVLEECARVGCQKVFQRAHQGLGREPLGWWNCGTAVHRGNG